MPFSDKNKRNNANNNIMHEWKESRFGFFSGKNTEKCWKILTSKSS